MNSLFKGSLDLTEQGHEPCSAGFCSFFPGQVLPNPVINHREANRPHGMHGLAIEDMKPLCGLDNGTDLPGRNLKKGLIQGGAEFTGANPSQIAAVHGGCTVRMEKRLL